jgi:hypothetical protein
VILEDIYFYQDIFYLQSAMFLFVGFIGYLYIVGNGNTLLFRFVSFSFIFMTMNLRYEDIIIN